MAGAEARAVWQRAANRCFVQEDAKRAPKLACCQSSSATSKSTDAGPASKANESEHAAVNATHFIRESSFSNPSPCSMWWLNLQPNYYGCQKGLTDDRLNALEDEVETSKASGESKTCSNSCQTSPELMDVVAKHETLEIDSVGCSESKQTNDFSLESDYSWIEGNKAEPWWRTADRDELASFVTQKSLDHIENCDLPPPQKKHLRGHPFSSISDDKIKAAPYAAEAKPRSFSNLTPHVPGNLGSLLMHKRQQDPSADEGLLYFASDKSSSYTPMHEDVTDKQQIFEGDPSKAQLMEALCHSQTRAREAEEAAKQAYAEKEHIVALIFKQASQLFAYKQWFQLLQLETLYSQIKNKDQPTISTLFPVALPWKSSCEGRKSRKRKQESCNAKQEWQDKPKCDITTYAVAFALGMSLVGAGLLLGWTVGWMMVL
ncbi:hypothetical protein RIF29_24059 [Crotalaria pallida]|uniref:Transmembrane protein n=1 Tax=Crotalaria pallida TaxID=3830 RepID=A0AAN9EP74_CROPI